MFSLCFAFEYVKFGYSFIELAWNERPDYNSFFFIVFVYLYTLASHPYLAHLFLNFFRSSFSTFTSLLTRLFAIKLELIHWFAITFLFTYFNFLNLFFLIFFRITRIDVHIWPYKIRYLYIRFDWTINQSLRNQSFK